MTTNNYSLIYYQVSKNEFQIKAKKRNNKKEPDDYH